MKVTNQESITEPNSEEDLDDPDSSNDTIISTESRNKRFIIILIFCNERFGSISKSNMLLIKYVGWITIFYFDNSVCEKINKNEMNDLCF